jgi:hypothetical protein
VKKDQDLSIICDTMNELLGVIIVPKASRPSLSMRRQQGRCAFLPAGTSGPSYETVELQTSEHVQRCRAVSANSPRR